jgi:ABC-2 type transport system ATP-binding protein
MPVIEVARLRTRAAVTDVSFTVERGEIFGIVGPSRAGKSTTVECVAGLRRPGGGTVRVLGLDARRDGAELRRRVGIQLQHAELPGKLRVWEALDLYSSFYPQPADWRELLDAFGLSAWHDTAFGALTIVAKRRLAVALALVGDPEIAIFDAASPSSSSRGARKKPPRSATTPRCGRHDTTGHCGGEAPPA